jgi:Lrp/AsnC family transcriptional regulator, leucine-responsive regulatory protein
VKKDLFQNIEFDELDRAILRELQIDARITNANLARKIHLSQPAVHNRIKKLEKRGIIRRYTAELDTEIIGYDLICFLQIRTDGAPQHLRCLQETVAVLPHVQECHHLTGEYDILIKVVMKHRQQLEAFIEQHISPLEGIQQLQTNIVLSEFKSRGDIPLD